MQENTRDARRRPGRPNGDDGALTQEMEGEQHYEMVTVKKKKKMGGQVEVCVAVVGV